MAFLLPAIAWGVLLGWWTPRGPLTITQLLVSVAVSLALGLAAGRLVRSRRVLWAAPIVFQVALELTRVPVADPPHASLLGAVALLAGRGVQAVVTLLPLVLGQIIGRWRRGAPRRIGWLRGSAVALPAAGLLLFTVTGAIPARTAPIPGGVAELTHVGDLGVLIRGADPHAPVLLFVPGAPGGSEIGAARTRLGVLERRFVLVTLDRRGGGSSYPALDPTSGVTLDRMVDDTLAVTDYLRNRFHQQRIYLLGHSGGSIIAVLAVQRHPEKYAAYIGTGQAVNLPASDRIFYHDILAWARSTGREALARRLVAQGSPPYPSVWDYEPIMLNENQAYRQADPGFGVGVREYTLLQKIHTVNAILDTWAVLYPRMQAVDLRRDVPSLDVPVWFVQGGNEMRGLAELFAQWEPGLRAPIKRVVMLPGAGHRAMFEQPDRLAAVLDEVVRDAPAI